MKKLFFFLIFGMSQLNAQITLEHTFPGNITQDIRFLYLNLGNDDYKYVVINYSLSKFDIYNLDYTPYMLNVVTALTISGGQNDIAYISKNLFDCDDNTIEYALIHEYSDFKVYRTDGTSLFSRSNVIALYCYGCNNGSTVPVPIYNTPTGARLILNDKLNNSNYVYSLCGSLPLQTNDLDKGNFVTVYPIPNDQNNGLNFKINLPYISNNNQIEIYNSGMQLLDQFEFTEQNTTLTKNYNFASGVYLYILKSSGKVLKTGKFVIQ